MPKIQRNIAFAICSTLLFIIPLNLRADTFLFNAPPKTQADTKAPLNEPPAKENLADTVTNASQKTQADIKAPLNEPSVKENLANTVAPDQKCISVQFERGYISSAINDKVTPEEIKCYSLGVGIGQTIELHLVSRYQNTVFSIEDVVDNQDKHTFVTTRKKYQITVSQMMRSAKNDFYTFMFIIR